MGENCIPESKRVQAPSAPGFKTPPGLRALGSKGSVWYRLTPPGLFEGLPAQGSYVVRCVRIPHGIRKSGEVGL